MVPLLEPLPQEIKEITGRSMALKFVGDIWDDSLFSVSPFDSEEEEGDGAED